jgi:hypothetical protein
VLGIHEDRGDARLIECGQQGLFLFGPFVGVAGTVRHQAGNRATSHGTGALNEHLEIESVGEPPLDLADVVAGQS